jgi:hypothetical protein
VLALAEAAQPIEAQMARCEDPPSRRQLCDLQDSTDRIQRTLNRLQTAMDAWSEETENVSRRQPDYQTQGGRKRCDHLIIVRLGDGVGRGRSAGHLPNGAAAGSITSTLSPARPRLMSCRSFAVVGTICP